MSQGHRCIHHLTSLSHILLTSRPHTHPRIVHGTQQICEQEERGVNEGGETRRQR